MAQRAKPTQGGLKPAQYTQRLIRACVGGGLGSKLHTSLLATSTHTAQLWSEIALPGTALSLTDMYTKGLSNLINTLAQSSMSANVPTLNQQVNSGRQTDTAGCQTTDMFCGGSTVQSLRVKFCC